MNSVLQRNDVHVKGNGEKTILFAPGFGGDQHTWDYLLPYFPEEYKLVLFDYVGAGKSDVSQYDSARYATLDGYATDVIEICEALELAHVVFVGHSVSSMIGLLAAIRRPSLFSSLIMIGPSPRFINDHEYTSAFDEETIHALLEMMDKDYIGWAKSLAPAIMDPANGEKMGQELTESFCYVDPKIAGEFARATFLSDNRADLKKAPVKSLSITTEADIVSPLVVVQYIQQQMPGNTMVQIEGRGHCPHIARPETTAKEILAYITKD